MIFNITGETFGGRCRNGDLIGVTNVVRHLQMKHGDNDIKFYMSPDSVQESEHCQKFLGWLQDNTSFFSKEPSENTLAWKRVNIWDFRGISGDVVRINNPLQAESKVCVFPLFDAPYNNYRNWHKELYDSVVHMCRDRYKDLKKVICISDAKYLHGLDTEGFEVSTDFMDNINHILTSAAFIGGDTGTSHFCSVLTDGPVEKTYLYSGRGLLHTIPFYVLEGQGKLIRFWGDFEGTTWQ